MAGEGMHESVLQCPPLPQNVHSIFLEKTSVQCRGQMLFCWTSVSHHTRNEGQPRENNGWPRKHVGHKGWLRRDEGHSKCSGPSRGIWQWDTSGRVVAQNATGGRRSLGRVCGWWEDAWQGSEAGGCQGGSQTTSEAASGKGWSTLGTMIIRDQVQPDWAIHMTS
jgi:hypothetical protein